MNYQDAMSVCRVYGPPDLFVTCNTKWREIADALRYKPGQLPCDRGDLIVRIFHMKVAEFIHDIWEGRTIGAARAKFSASMIEQAGDDSGIGNNGAGAPDQTSLNTVEEQAGESVGDSSGSRAAAAEDSPSTAA